MYELTEKLRTLTPYEPITGSYKIRLDANESFIHIPEEELARAFASADLNRYPDPYAVKTIKAYSELYGINPDSVTAGNGSDELISIITACFLQKGDSVLCLSPDFSMYSFYPYLYELDVKCVDKNDDLTIDIDKVIECVNSNNIKAVLFSNPCNPTSLGLSRDKVLKLINSVSALVVVDEAYMDFWDKEQSVITEADGFGNVIVLKTCSKALAMAGIRLGFAIANARITNALRAAKSPYNVNSLTQSAAEYLLLNKEAVNARIDAVKASAAELYKGICALEMPCFEVVYKPVTNFVFIKTDKAKAIYDYMLANSIAIRFMGKYLRITCGSTDENRELLRVLGSFNG